MAYKKWLIFLTLGEAVKPKVPLTFYLLFFRYDRIHTECNIALVGKYTQLEDSYASVIKALRHASYAVNRKLKLTVSYPLLLAILSWLTVVNELPVVKSCPNDRLFI